MLTVIRPSSKHYNNQQAAACLHDTPKALFIKGYLFRVLSVKKLSPLDRSFMTSLALIDDQIVDIAEGALSNFTSLTDLYLDFNNLTHVTQSWFTAVTVNGVPPHRMTWNLETRKRPVTPKITREPPFIIIATNGYLDKQVASSPDQCRRVWDDNQGVNIPLLGGPSLKVVSLGVNNLAFVNVALMFYNMNYTITSNITENYGNSTPTSDTQNVTCIQLTRNVTYQSYFSVLQFCIESEKTCLDDIFDVDQMSFPTSETEGTKQTTSTSRYQSANTVTTILTSDTWSTMVVITVLMLMVPVCTFVLLSPLASFVMKRTSTSQNMQAINDSTGWRIWMMPNDSVPSVVRSRSLPNLRQTHRELLDDTVSCWSLPADPHSIDATYYEIPDHMAAAQRPLPALPHTYYEIPSYEIVQVRSTSLPTIAHNMHKVLKDDVLSCKSLPAALESVNPTYCRIKDENDGEEEDGPILFYAAAAEPSLPTLTKSRQNKHIYRHMSTSAGQSDQAARKHINAYVLVLPTSQDGLPTLPNTYWPWQIPGDGSSMQHTAYLPNLPNTYWPWEIPEGRLKNAPQRASLPTLPNTYWPWEIPGDGSRNMPQTAHLHTQTNTYWPCQIPEGRLKRTPHAHRASLPTLHVPNTYWPWKIPGDECTNTPHTPYPSTLPNTYWPWEIPEGRLKKTPHRPSLPTLHVPNTYWPWEIPEDGCRNTPAHTAYLSALPNTYWPWEIPEGRLKNTPHRPSLPTLHVPNTYWPWKIPGDGCRNTAAHTAYLSALPNTYWPWEIPCEEYTNTPGRTSLL
ncbi:hypothetical protein Bbelb_113820 [Branchiostoma belcheri]|nr:hypothetical protein Bbelb_113820 [Branchiostoma belcheri]